MLLGLIFRLYSEIFVEIQALFLEILRFEFVTLFVKPYCFDAATATGAPLVANRRTISYGRPPAVAHGPSVTLF